MAGFGGGGGVAMPPLVQRIFFDASSAQAAEAQSTRSMNAIGGGVGRLQNALGALAGAVGFGLVLAGIDKMVGSGARYASTVRSMELATGGTAEQASQLVFVLQRVGISADSAQRPFVLLSRNIENGSKNFTQYFSQAQLAQMAHQSLIQVLPELASKYQSLGSAVEKNAFLMNVFGRGGIQLRNLMELQAGDFARLSNEAQRYGLVLSQDNVDAFYKFQQGQRAVGQAFQGIELQISEAVIPVFEDLDKVVTAVLTAFSAIPAPIRTIGLDFVTAATAAGLLVKGVQGIAGIIGGVVDRASETVHGLTDSFVGLGSGTKIAADSMEVVDQATGSTTQLVAGLDGSLSRVAVTAESAGAGLDATAAGELAVGGAGEEAAAGVGLLGAAMLALPALAVGGALIESALSAHALAKNAKEAADQIHDVAQAQALANAAAERAKSSSILQTLNPIADIFHTTDYDKATAAAKAYTERVRELKAAQREANDSLSGGGSDAQTLRDEYAGLAKGVRATAQAASDQSDALDKLNNAVDVFGSTSQQGVAAQQAYAKSLFDSQVAAGLDVNDLKAVAKAQSDAADAAVKAAQQEEEANQKRIDSNFQLIASFDLIKQSGDEASPTTKGDDERAHLKALADLAKAEQNLVKVRANHKSQAADIQAAEQKVADAEKNVHDTSQKLAEDSTTALQKFTSSTSSNLKTFNQFYDDIETLARNGGEALARRFEEMGPQSAAAAHEAVQQIGTKGFGDLEGLVANSIRTAKRGDIDKSLEEWTPNFGGKASDAGQALRDAMSESLDQLGGDLRGATQNLSGLAEGAAIAIEKAFDSSGATVVANWQTTNGHLVSLFQTTDGQIGVATSDMQGHITGLRKMNFDPLKLSALDLATKLGVPRDVAQHILDVLRSIPPKVSTSIDVSSSGLGPKTLAMLEKGQTYLAVSTNFKAANDDAQAMLDALGTGGSTDLVVGVHAHGGGSIGSPYGFYGPISPFHSGGSIRRMHGGGNLAKDEVPIIAQVGEFMFSRPAVQHWGLPLLHSMNRMHSGGTVANGAAGFTSSRVEALLEAVLGEMRRSPMRSTTYAITEADDARKTVQEIQFAEARSGVR